MNLQHILYVVVLAADKRGACLQDSEVDVQDCTIRGNKAGSIQYMAATLLSPTHLQGTNSITPAPVLT